MAKQYDVEELIKVIGNKILGYNEANIIVQYNDKILNRFSTDDSGLAFIYKGKEYKSSTDYSWEKEARSAQFELWKEFKKLYYKNE